MNVPPLPAMELLSPINNLPYNKIDYVPHLEEDFSPLPSCSEEGLIEAIDLIQTTTTTTIPPPPTMKLPPPPVSKSCPRTVSAATTVTTTTASSSSSMSHPLTNKDIIVGRHRQAFHHEGNLKFRSIISKFLPKYLHVSSRHERANLSKEIVLSIESTGSKFLKQHPETGHWIELTLTEKRNKVGHALRDLAKVKRKTTITSSTQKMSKKSKASAKRTTKANHNKIILETPLKVPAVLELTRSSSSGSLSSLSTTASTVSTTSTWTSPPLPTTITTTVAPATLAEELEDVDDDKTFVDEICSLLEDETMEFPLNLDLLFNMTDE